MLYIVPTPIGNLQDITLRSLELLKNVELILAEDTRTSQKLLNHYGIRCPLTPYHQHNEHEIVSHLLQQLAKGKKMALISDAGTPGISDAAFLLVRACIQAGIPVECLPGATAFVPALVVSGLPTNRFVFEGFLPLKKGRKTLLTKLAEEERTLVFYESPHRLLKTLEEFVLYFGETRNCSVSRELTKLHEETIRGSLRNVADHFRAREGRGEMVIVVQGCQS
jgi:16S rRNA (cytidine1402-2'-O)-methyltransferase